MPNLTTRYRVFPTGSDLIPPGTASLVDHSPLTLSAPSISLPDPQHANQFLNYAFLFWNVGGSATFEGTTKNAFDQIQDVGTSSMFATAWYTPTGGGSGGGHEGLATVAFSDDADSVLSQTPIQSVTPAGGWAGASATFVDLAASGATVTAKNLIGLTETFEQWLIFGSGSAVGPALTEPQNGAALAIASYKTPARSRLVETGREGQLGWVILGGIAVGGGGIEIPLGGGPPVPVGPVGPDAMARLSPSERSIAVGMAIHSFAETLGVSGHRTNLQREALSLVEHGVSQLRGPAGAG